MKTLTDAELNREMCLWMGYEKQTREDIYWHRGLGRYFKPNELPNYLTALESLGLCHAAEEKLTEGEHKQFRTWLWEITTGRFTE